MTESVVPEQHLTPQQTPGADRVREHTDPERLAVLDRQIRERVARYVGASNAELTDRIHEVEHESDIERVLEANASVLALVGLSAGVFVNRKLLLIPVIILSFLLQHAIQGWCPPVPVLRRLGVQLARRSTPRSTSSRRCGVTSTN